MTQEHHQIVIDALRATADARDARMLVQITPEMHVRQDEQALLGGVGDLFHRLMVSLLARSNKGSPQEMTGHDGPVTRAYLPSMNFKKVSITFPYGGRRSPVVLRRAW